MEVKDCAGIHGEVTTQSSPCQGGKALIWGLQCFQEIQLAVPKSWLQAGLAQMKKSKES